MRVLGLTMGLVLAAQTAFGLGLEEMQDMALANRETIKRYVINLEKSERDIGLARAGFLPSVDVSYRATSLDEDSFTENSENSVLLGAVSWNLFNGFKDKYQLESSKQLKEVEQHQLNGLKQDIQLNVALRYLDVYERRANLEVARKNLETLQKIYRDAQNRLNVGLIDRNELLKFKVDLDDTDIQVEKAKADLHKSVNLLGREIGKKLELAQLEFDLFDSIPGKMDPQESEARMLAQRSEILALKKLEESSRLQMKAAESDYYPKVDFVGSYRNYDDDFFNERDDLEQSSSINGTSVVTGDELRAQVTVSLNLYQGNATQESVAKARLETMGLQYDIKELGDSLRTELQNLHTDFDVSLRNIEVAEVGIEQAEENLRITRLKYGEGLQRESDLLDAVANLSRAQFNHVATVRTAFENHFNIVRMVESF